MALSTGTLQCEVPRLFSLVTALAAATVGCSVPKAPAAWTITGLVDATEVDVASKVPGRVHEILVREGDPVKQGQQLVVIETEEIEAKLHQVGAAVAVAEARLKLARRGARDEDKRATQSQLQASQHQLELAQKMYDRMASLLASGSIAQATFDDAESKLNLAKDQVEVARTRSDLAVKGSRPEEIEALAALVRQGQGSLAEVESYSKESVQRAPLDGEVAKLVLHRGELAATGTPILTLVDRSDLWVTFPVREDLLRGLTVGTTLDVEVPALGRHVPMKIFHIAALGDFATWRATTEKNGFDLKSFEVKARPVTPVGELRPGMTARVRLAPGV
jgi:HlyD family secretion protein